MDALQIRHYHRRIAAPRRLAAEVGRAERLLETAARELLPLLLARAGVGSEELVCIRELRSFVRWRADRPDQTLIAVWSDALLERLQLLLQSADPRIVRYRNARAALLDLLVGSVAGDRSRAWAWRQLELIRYRGDVWPSDRVAVDLLGALEAQPDAIVPAMIALARSGQLQRFLFGQPAVALPRLAVAALRAAGCSPGETIWLLAATLDAPPPSAAGAGTLADARAHRLFDPLAVHCAQAAEPAALQSAAAVLLALALDPALGLRAPAAQASRVHRVRVELAAARTAERRASVTGGPPAQAHGTRGRVQIGRERSNALEPSLGPVGSCVEAQPQAAAIESAAGAAQTEPAVHRSDWGGLLFLLHLVASLELPEQLLGDVELAERPLSLVLHRLACSMLPLQPDDPAALAFAGLSPDQEPPETERPLSEHEQRVLAAVAHDLIRALTERMQRRDGRVVLREVAARRVEIVADPGWIEVRFERDQVSTDVRRAGLDLDPGWLPWLGVVMRFVYA